LLSMLAVVSGVTVVGAATFTVANTNGNGADSLEQAIIDANASSDSDDTIEFDIPGGGVPTIVDSLPAVTGPVLIDGTTQAAGFVELQNPGGNALSITGSGSIVRSLVINSSATGVSLGSAAGGNTITGCRIGTDPTGTAADANQVGVLVQGPSGGNNTIANNLVSGNSTSGISVLGSNNIVTGNVIGLDVTQTQGLGSGTGIIINSSSDNRVGGTGATDGNVIAGFQGTGISVQNGASQRNVIQGNRIGTNAANASGLGIGTGVAFASVTTGNVLGGTDAGAGNLIVAASSNGVSMVNASNVTVQGNTIGTAALPNAANGLDLANADDNTLEDNVISGNGQAGINFRAGSDGNTVRGNEISQNDGAGIAVSGGQMDRFTENAIHDNGGLGIDLGINGVTANDPLDADVAPGHNDAQNYPDLSMVSSSEVTGTLNSTADTAFTVEFFASSSCDGSGNGEGATFLGAIDVMTDVAGNADIMLSLPPTVAGQVITATAIAPDGDTSEFSACSGTVPTTTTTSTSTTTITVPSTTSTTIPNTTTTSTTSSSSPTSSSAPPTTTTTLGDSCAAEPVGATFRSLNCRLAALLARVNAAADLGSFQSRLPRLLESAKVRKDQAEDFCREPDSRRTSKRLKQADRKMSKVGQTLRSLRARRTLPDLLRRELLEAAIAVRADLRTLRRAVGCPNDAG
jgi:trimeric autotransporter adhesin